LFLEATLLDGIASLHTLWMSLLHMIITFNLTLNDWGIFGLLHKYAIGMLGYVVNFDACDEYGRLVKSTMMEAFKRFFKAIKESFELKYL
jgi:hypothetical protein